MKITQTKFTWSKQPLKTMNMTNYICNCCDETVDWICDACECCDVHCHC